MNKKIILSVVIVFISLFLFAEKTIEQQVGELERKLNKVSGQERVDILNDIAYELFRQSPQKSLDYANQAFTLSQKINYRKGSGTSLQNLGNAYIISGKYDKALEYSLKSLKIREEIGDKKAIATSLSNIGVIYNNISKYDKALEYHLKSMKIREEIGNKKGIAASLNNIGVIYQRLTKYDKALEYHLKSMKINKKIGDKDGIANSLGNIGLIYKDLNKYDKALEYHLKSLKIREEMGDKEGIAGNLLNIGIAYQDLSKNDKALKYHLKSLKIFKETGNKNGIQCSLNSIGNTYYQLCKYDKALEYVIKALKVNEGIGSKTGSTSCLIDLGNIYIKLNNFSKAFTSLNQGLKTAKEIKTNKIIAKYYNTFTDYYVAKEDFRNALKYYRLFHETDKEIFNEKTQKQINQLQAGYEAEKREKEIELLKKDKELLNKDKALLTKDNKIKTFMRNSFIIGFILVLIILALLFNKYMYLFAFWKKHSYIGQYRIIGKIGSGGMGTIYKAKNITDKTQTVAIKVLNEELLKDETQRKRFSRESLIIDQLEHPNIIKIYERGEDKKTIYIVMEFLAGKTLGQILNKRLPLTDSLPIMIQVSDALVQIHSKNIVHRDLNPNNIMLIERDRNQNFVKLLDFGLARSGFETTITQAGYALGTIRYMSPEQLIGNKNITIKSDIFSLGIIFYEMVTGTHAFSSEIGEIANDILYKLLTEPIKIQPDLPVALNHTIMNMIEKDPQTRPVIEDVLKTLKEISQ